MKVSIAIPCHNAERWITQAIESALAQTGVEPEVIVVDDGSTDRSREMASAFGGKVQLLHGERRGANHARNLALQRATGAWVQFLDADDYLEPAKIEQQLAETSGGTSADVLYSPVWIERWSDRCETREKSGTSPDADWDTQWIRWHIPQTGGALWRREKLLGTGGWKDGQPCCQEHELYLRARKGGLHFQYAPTPGAIYRIWSEDTLCRKDPLLVTQVRTGLMDEMWAWLRETGRVTDHHRREIGQACFEMARTWARYDLRAAAKYHAERKSRGLICPAGPAAPRPYRMVYAIAGFTVAERAAKLTR